MNRYYMGTDPGRPGEESRGAVVVVRDGKFFDVNPIPPGISEEERTRRLGKLLARFAPVKISDAAIAAEHEALDKITRFLDRPENRRGRSLEEIAEGIELSRGRVMEVCRKSEIILKQRPRNRRLWFNDWDECEPEFRPKRKKGRPPTPKKG